MAEKNHSLSKDKIPFLLLENIHPRGLEHLRCSDYHDIRRKDGALEPPALAEALGDVRFLGIRSRTRVTADVLAQAPKLTAIGCFCIGTDQVDLDAAQRHGIPVFNAPYANTRSVAELVLAEIIMLLRGIPAKNAAAHRGEWLKTARDAFEARGKTLGIVGYGHIGSQLGILAEGLGMKVRYHDIVDKLPLGNAEPVDDLITLLQTSDVVSLHVPDSAQTRGLIGAEALSAMARGSLLINASRGQVVDIPALAGAIRERHLAGAAIDVFPAEPQSPDQTFVSELRGLDNVLLTPHIGGSTQEAQENIALDVAAKLVRYSDNGSTIGAVNFPEVALPDHAGTSRILHIHNNEPGVLHAINTVFSSSSVNIAAQYLQTRDQIGYVVMDVETPDSRPLLEALRAIPATIRTRVLY